MPATLTIALPDSFLAQYESGEVEADDVFHALEHALRRMHGDQFHAVAPGHLFDPPMPGHVVIWWSDGGPGLRYRVEFVPQSEAE